MDYILLLLLGAILSFGFTPITIVLARKFMVIDIPWRVHPAILHHELIPRAGGLAPYLAIVTSYFLFLYFNTSFSLDKHIVGILIAGLVVVVVGLLDDKYDLNPYFRLGTNIVAAAIVVGAGVGITWFTNPLGGQIYLDEIIFRFNIPDILPFGLLSGPHSIILLADLFAFFWIIWVMNALNWSSGIDGQLPGIATIGLVALGIATERYVISDPTQIAVAILAFVSAGAFIGFLPWSFYPQKIMPGYGGATLAGLLLASLSILAGAKLATTFLLLIVPLIDGLWAIIRRIFAGKSPVWGDKYHLHHQLLAIGLSKFQVVLFYYFIVGMFAFLALSLDNRGRVFAIAVGGVLILATLITLAHFVKRFEKAKATTKNT